MLSAQNAAEPAATATAATPASGTSAAASPAAAEPNGSGAPSAPPGGPLPPHPTPSTQTSVPVGRIAAGVISGRLSNPRTLVIAAGSFAVVCIAIGYAIGRAR
jgi:hypothetical protein